MSSADLFLLHPPSVYDFRQKTILYGPSSDFIPSSPIFEMYPIGFTSIVEYLEHAGYRVRIVNLAVRMLKDRNFNAEQLIKSLKAPLFGIDLHWLVHAHGAIEVARIVKKYHPTTKIVIGGLSASYYSREIFQYPEIDYVLRGDSTEEPLRQLMECIIKGREPALVPNLLWRGKEGKVQENPFSYIPADLSDVMVRYYDHTFHSVIKYRDLASYIPFKDWLSYPITAVLTSRGCSHNCVVCGGSASAFRHFYHRERPSFRSPTVVAQDVKRIERLTRGPIFILGDICQPGEDYAWELLHLLEEGRVKNQIILELFSPVSRELMTQMGKSCPHFCLEISPESHDQEVREASGRHYSNEALEETISHALEVGCSRLDIFFMIGLPKQTSQSVMETVDYCAFLLDRFKGDKRLCLFIAPLSPFLDPGSLGFEQPQRYGYRLLFRTLEEHRQALLAPSWKYALNYETRWMDRQKIVETAYEAGLRLNHLKAKYGLISREMAEARKQRIEAALKLMQLIDDILTRGDYASQQEELSRLKAQVDEVNMSPASEKRELELPVGLLRFNPLRPLWSWLTGR